MSANKNQPATMPLDNPGGTNQSSLRDHNQRLVLSLLQRHQRLAKSEIALRTGLSAQTVTVNMRLLEEEDLLLRGDPVRGKVGQPSIPMSLNPDGAFSIGLKIGRRSADLMIVDLIGQQRAVLRKQFSCPSPKVIKRFSVNGINKLLDLLPAGYRKRVAGVGISMPNELWHWADKIDAPQKTMDHWRDYNFKDELAEFGLPVYTLNDATAACGAELVYGKGAALHDFLYFFVGTFIGGGVVLNQTLYQGRAGYAGALGPMPVRTEAGKYSQLIDYASVIQLEWMLTERGIDATGLWKNPEDWSAYSSVVDEWITNTAEHLAAATVSAFSVIDFTAAVLDGAIPTDVKERMVTACNRELKKMNLQGLAIAPEIVAGTVGSDARAIGAAWLPLFNRYFLDTGVLFKDQNANG